MTSEEQNLGSPNIDKHRGAGGTPGGLGEFFAGLAMTAGGGYLLLNQVTVSSGYWNLWGYNGFGISLIPLLIGVALDLAIGDPPWLPHPVRGFGRLAAGLEKV